jgi:hypothetical protein
LAVWLSGERAPRETNPKRARDEERREMSRHTRREESSERIEEHDLFKWATVAAKGRRHGQDHNSWRIEVVTKEEKRVK